MAGLRAVQPLLVFCGQFEKLLYCSLVVNFFGEATASGDLDE
jgi:hypothetical protein